MTGYRAPAPTTRGMLLLLVLDTGKRGESCDMSTQLHDLISMQTLRAKTAPSHPGVTPAPLEPSTTDSCECSRAEKCALTSIRTESEK